MREEETRRTNNYQDSPATMSHCHASRSTLGQHQPGVTLRTNCHWFLPPLWGHYRKGTSWAWWFFSSFWYRQHLLSALNCCKTTSNTMLSHYTYTVVDWTLPCYIINSSSSGHLVEASWGGWQDSNLIPSSHLGLDLSLSVQVSRNSPSQSPLSVSQSHFIKSSQTKNSILNLQLLLIQNISVCLIISAE